MKMNKAKRIIAIVLSVLMLMSALPMSALAETVSDAWYQEMLEKAARRYYERIMATENVEEFDEAIYEVYLEQFVNFFESLNAAQQMNMDSHAYEIFKAFEDERDGVWEDNRVTVYPTKDFTNAAPFGEPVTGTASMFRMMSKAAGETDNGLELSKTISATDAENGEYLLTLEAWATGSKVTSIVTEQVPTDIVLVLDQSGSMDDSFTKLQFTQITGRTPAQLYSSRNNLYVKRSDGSYAPVTVTRTEDITTTSYTTYSDQWNNTYYNYRGTLYHKCNDEEVYGKLTVNRYGSGNRAYGYYYTCANCGEIYDSTNAEWYDTPSIHNQIYTLSETTLYNYTFTYEDVDGTIVTQTVSQNAAAPSGAQWDFHTSSTVQGYSKLDALKDAVTTFATNVANKAKGEDGILGNDAEGNCDDVDHTISVVGFASGNLDDGTDYENTEIFIGATPYGYGTAASSQYANAPQDMSTPQGVANVTASIGALGSSGGTYVDCGIELANGILAANPVPTGEKRNRVVIVFTDGAPGYNGNYGGNNYGSSGDAALVAEDALEKIEVTKDTHKATVYTVGIFTGADASSAGSNGNNASATNRANWFMQNLSSNDGTPQTPSYYLSASDSSALNNIFESISQNIESGGAATTLSSSTVVQDVLTDQFVLPDGANPSQINVYTMDVDSTTGAFDGVRDNFADATIGINGNKISVSNFDFSANWVGSEEDTSHNVTYRGKKLIIEIPIKVKPGFLGGNNVTTNADGSGVFANPDKAAADDPVEDFTSPSINVAISKPKLTVEDKNVYLLDQPTSAELLEGSVTTYVDSYGNDIDLGEDGVLDSWQTAYVTITPTNPADKDKGLTEDAGFEATLTITPKEAADTNKPGTAASEQSVTATGAIRVFKPVLQFADTAEEFGSTMTESGEDAYYAAKNWHDESTAWKHVDAVGNEISSNSVTMLGDAPQLTLSYADNGEEWLNDSNKVVGLTDVPVNVTVKIGDEDVTEHSTSIRLKCACKTSENGVVCDHDNNSTEASMGNNPEFIVHIYHVYGHVAFTKTVVDNGKEIPDFVEKVFTFQVDLKDKDGNALTGSYPVEIDGVASGTVANGGTITISGGQTATIKNLPHESTYIISEDKPNGYVLTLKKNNVEITDSLNAVGTIIAGDVEDCDKYVFTNTYTPAGLEIKKVIEGNDSDIDKQNTEDDIFTFLVTLQSGQFNVSGAADTADNGTQIFTEGVPRKFRIRGENSLQIAGVPIDSAYSVIEVVEETNDGNTVKVMPDGYAFKEVVTVVDNKTSSTSSNISQSGTLAEVNVVRYVNTYTTGSLTINKQIVDEDGNIVTDSNVANDQFKVNVTLPAGTYPVNGTATVFNGTAKPFTITGAGSLTITGIPKDAAYTVTEDTANLPAGYTLKSYDNDTSKTAATGTISADGSAAIITNTYQTGDLKITKEVVGKYIAEDEFVFTVTLPEGTFAYKIYGADGYQVYPDDYYNSNGKISNGDTITLQDGWYAVIEDIPAGEKADYTVVETAKDKYTTTATNANGKIVANAETVAAFTNTHKTGNLKFSKEVLGANVSSEEKFGFVVMLEYNGFLAGTFESILYSNGTETKTQVEFPSTGSYTFNIGHGESLEIRGLPYGTYCTVTEGQAANYDVSTVSQNATIGAGTTSELKFTNTRKSSGLIIKKVVKAADDSELTDQVDVKFTFNVRLTAPDHVTLESSYAYTKGDESAVLLLKEAKDAQGNAITYKGKQCYDGTITLKHGQSATFSTLPVGTHFQITEVEHPEYVTTSTNPNGDTATSSAKTVTFTNTHKFGKLAFKKVVDPGKDENGEPYEIPSYVDSVFRFTVTLKDKNGTALSGNYNYSVSAGTDAAKYPARTETLTLNNGSGVIQLADGQIATIEGLAPGTTYTVVEATPVGFDKESETDENNGTAYIDAGKTDSLTITNTYKPAGLKITKAIAGEDKDANCADDVFTFNVRFSVSGAFPIQYNNNDSSKVKSDAIGSDGYFHAVAGTTHTIEITGENWISLLSIPFNSNYTVTEVDLPVGYRAEDTTYKVDDATAVKGTSHTGYFNRGDGQTDNHTDDVTFTNTYVTYDLVINKSIVNPDNNTASDVFYINVSGIPAGTYKVNGTDTAFDGGSKPLSVTGAGSIKIEGIPIGTAYEVSEDTDELTVGYSKSVGYDNYKRGTIVDSDISTIVTNTYEVGELAISKTVVGKFVPDDEFEFTVGGMPDGVYPYTVNGGSEQIMTVSNGTGTLNLEDGETAVITRLPIGANYTVTENLTDAQKIDYDVTKTDDTGTISATRSEAKFTNTHKVGNLKITKTVQNVTSSEKFTFTVTVNYNGGPLVVDGPYMLKINNVASDAGLTFNNGVATVELAHVESAEIVGLPAGATYTVVEAANDRYTTTKTGETGTIAAEDPETEASETCVAAFTNTHTLGDLVITKTVVPVEGYNLTDEQKSKEFEFTVTLEPQNGAVLNSTYTCVMDGIEKSQELNAVENSNNKTFTVTLKHDGVYVIKGLPIGTEYTVVETVDADYSVSKTGDDSVIVADNTSTTDVVEAATAAFTNTHKPGQLKVTKQIMVPKDAVIVAADEDGDAEGDTGTNEGSIESLPEELTKVFNFTVTLTPNTSDGKYFTLPDKVAYTKTNADGTIETGELDLTAVADSPQQSKTCTFTLMHGEELVLEGLRPGTQYSVREAVADGYVPTYSITDECDPTTRLMIDAGKTDTYAYTNIYNPNTLVIGKNIVDAEGKPLTGGNVADDVFTFEVTLPIGEYTLTDQNNNPTILEFDETTATQVISIVGPGEVNISGIPRGYDYTVKEIGMPNGYSYKSVQAYMQGYNATDGKWEDVEDSRETTVVAEKSVSSEISYKGNRVEFTNTYTTGELEISKTVVGTDAPKGDKADNFGFTVNFYVENVEEPAAGEEAPIKEVQDGTFTCVITDEKGQVVENSLKQITNGTGTFNLKHGWRATISDIPTGTYYEVKEAVHTKYTTTKTGDTGTISATKSEAAFTNTYGYGSLIVKKSFSAGVTPEDGETFLFAVKQGDNVIAEIVMSGKDIKADKDSVTLSPLAVGTYTVVEDTNWSWRYTPVDGEVKTAVIKPEANPTVEFENTKKTDQWLDGNAYADNDYMGTPK